MKPLNHARLVSFFTYRQTEQHFFHKCWLRSTQVPNQNPINTFKSMPFIPESLFFDNEPYLYDCPSNPDPDSLLNLLQYIRFSEHQIFHYYGLSTSLIFYRSSIFSWLQSGCYLLFPTATSTI